MAGTAVRFKTPYNKYDPATIFEVDHATKTLNPFASGEAYQGAGYQFGQEQVVDPGQFAEFSIGPAINPKTGGQPQMTGFTPAPGPFDPDVSYRIPPPKTGGIEQELSYLRPTPENADLLSSSASRNTSTPAPPPSAGSVRFAQGYNGYDPSTIFQVDPATKTLSPYGSGNAYTQAGNQFGQETLADPASFAGFGVGPIINERAAQLNAVKDQLNNFQNQQFNAETGSTGIRKSSALEDSINAGQKEYDAAIEEYKGLRDRMAALTSPNYQQAYIDARNAAGIPGLESQFTDTRATRRELPYVNRAQSGNAGIQTEGQLAADTAQKDIPLEIREANLIDRLTLAADFVNNSLKFKQMDSEAARQSIADAASMLTDTINMTRTHLQDLKSDQSNIQAQAEAKRKEEQARQDAGLQFRLDNNITTPFFNSGGTIYDSGSLEGIPDEKTFQQKYGMTLQDAEARGLVGKLDGGVQASRGLVLDLASNYPDAGIVPSDSLQQAQGKIKGSRIYQEQVRPPQYAGGDGSGTLAGSPIIDKNTDNGVKALIASRPGDGGYGATYEAVKAKYGEAVAKSYDSVYQDVFNRGVSVDAAFNNAKLGTSGELVDAKGKPVKLTAGQQTTIADWTTLSDLASQTLQLGEQIGFSGVGGAYKGTVSQFFAKQFGTGSQEEEQLRNLITNIKGTLAKARGGTSFTPNEQKLLDSYTPGINDSPNVIKAKLASLQGFIQTTVGNIYKSAGAANLPVNTETQSDGSVWQQNQDGTFTQIK